MCCHAPIEVTGCFCLVVRMGAGAPLPTTLLAPPPSPTCLDYCLLNIPKGTLSLSSGHASRELNSGSEPIPTPGVTLCVCRYKGSMDARSFQQHAARVAELTDTLLAERAADKAACALGAKPDSTSHKLDSEAAVSSNSATSSTASPSGRLSTSPGIPHEPAVPAATAGGAQTLFPPEETGSRYDSEDALASAEGDESCPPALPRDCAAASPASASIGGKATSFLPSGAGFPPSGSDDAGVLRGPHYCTVCNVSTTSAVHLQTHYMGSKHQRRLAQSQDRRQHSPHYCPICAISATSAVHLQLHLNGRAHQRKAKLAGQAQAGGTQRTTAALSARDLGGLLQVFKGGGGGVLSEGGREDVAFAGAYCFIC